MSNTGDSSNVSTAPTAQPVSPPQRSGCGLPCLLAAVLLAVLVCAGICGGIVWFLFLVPSVRHTEPYRAALEAVRQDPTVVERLGEPIEDGWIAAGEVSVDNGRGEANLFFDVSGPDEPAAVQAQARRREGVWRLVTVEVVFADGERHSVVLEPEGDEIPEELEEAPLWEP